MEPSYFVISGENRFGPATVEALNQWITENRITANMQVQADGSAFPIPLSAVPGIKIPCKLPEEPAETVSEPVAIQPPQAPMMSPPPPMEGTPYRVEAYANPPVPGNYYRQGPGQFTDPAIQKRATISLVLAIISLVVCWLPGIIPIVFAIMAQSALGRGDNYGVERNAKIANVWSIIVLSVTGVLILVYAGVMIYLVSSGQIR